MSHHHHHDHGHRLPRNRQRLAITLALAGGYMFAELIGGWLAHSLALLADAGHMFSDVAALALSFFAMWMAERPSPARRTFGYHRAEILAAMVNGALLIAVSIYIVVEAIHRLRNPATVHGQMMMGIAVGGLLVNLACLAILHRDRHDNLNLHGAWLHVLSDALGSVGAIIAGVLIATLGWNWADAVASAVIAILIVHASWRLLAEAVSVLMESAPKGIDVDEVNATIVATTGVRGVHDLHIWTITSGLESLSAHVVVDDSAVPADVLRSLRTILHDRFGSDHITIQIEPTDYEIDCRPCAVKTAPQEDGHRSREPTT
jgi:cobalt-zinc-cadmium efflux system protein